MFFKIYNFIKTNALNIENIIFIILLHPNYPNSKQPTLKGIAASRLKRLSYCQRLTLIFV
jgi:hypothetical protein